MKKNKMLIGVLLLCLVCIISTGCKKKGILLECERTSNEGIEVYGDISSKVSIEFDPKGEKPKKADIVLTIDVNKIETTDEKMKTISEKLQQGLCGKDKTIPDRDCKPVVEGNKITFKSNGLFNDYFINYTGEEKLDEMKEFLEQHEGMACSTKGDE